ncbi:MAG TPA: hypothetical protein V6C81_07820 [Planktothrix sp.]
MGKDNRSLQETLAATLVKSLLKIPGVKETITGGLTDVFYRQFDPELDIEKEIPGLIHIFTDGDIHYAAIPLEYDNISKTLVPGKAQLAALNALAAAGRLSDEKTDPTPEESDAVLEKAKATARYKQVLGGSVSLSPDEIR